MKMQDEVALLTRIKKNAFHPFSSFRIRRETSSTDSNRLPSHDPGCRMESSWTGMDFEKDYRTTMPIHRFLPRVLMHRKATSKTVLE